MIVLKMQLLTIDEDIEPVNLEIIKKLLEKQRNKFYSKICKMGLNVDAKNINKSITIYIPTRKCLTKRLS